MNQQIENEELPVKKRGKWRKILWSIFGVVLVGLACWGGVSYFYPYSEGVKKGELKDVVYKGFIFKTYEGSLYLSGRADEFHSTHEMFEFSVRNKVLAERMMHDAGKVLEVRYTEYRAAFPGRGNSRFVVNSIVELVMPKEEITIDPVQPIEPIEPEKIEEQKTDTTVLVHL